MTNNKAFDEAKMYIPGGVDSPVRAFASVDSNPPFIKSGKGAYIEDIEGNKYLDFVQSYGPIIFGHADDDIIKAINDTARLGTSFGAPTLNETNLAKLLVENLPIEQIRFVNSGTEATMSAIRLARAYAKKDGLIKFEGCYHGHSDGLLVSAGSGAATFNTPSSLGVSKNIVKDTFVAKYNDIKSVEAIVKKEQIGVIIIEPIAGNMGFVPAKKEFLTALRKLCDENNIVLIFDEVMSGFRCAFGGASEYYDIKADVYTYGKVIGAGLPCAAYGGSKKIMDLLSPNGGVYQAGTLSGNPLAMAAGIASMQKIISRKNELYKKLDELGKYLCDGLNAVANEYKVDFKAKNIGSMFGFFFSSDEVINYELASKSDMNMFKAFHKSMLEQGIYLAPSTYETAFICDSMTKDDMDKFIKAFKNFCQNL